MSTARTLSAAFRDDMRAQRVLAAIGRGRDAARSYSSIAEELGINRRSVEIAVNQLRRGGWAIASAGDGCWLTDSPAELMATFDSMRKRVRSQVVTYWAIRATARRMRAAAIHQETLFGDAA